MNWLETFRAGARGKDTICAREKMAAGCVKIIEMMIVAEQNDIHRQHALGTGGRIGNAL